MVVVSTACTGALFHLETSAVAAEAGAALETLLWYSTEMGKVHVARAVEQLAEDDDKLEMIGTAGLAVPLVSMIGNVMPVGYAICRAVRYAACYASMLCSTAVWYAAWMQACAADRWRRL